MTSTGITSETRRVCAAAVADPRAPAVGCALGVTLRVAADGVDELSAGRDGRSSAVGLTPSRRCTATAIASVTAIAQAALAYARFVDRARRREVLSPLPSTGSASRARYGKAARVDSAGKSSRTSVDASPSPAPQVSRVDSDAKSSMGWYSRRRLFLLSSLPGRSRWRMIHCTRCRKGAQPSQCQLF